ncbi:L,D-transpeptidase [Legionella taurinensis]|uniref:L,D-transpeptidase n=1 Tax=Legionella taurinensis TaxID=70611 RepID=A0A3A5LU15_9GAMM|nr:L,D-transpeptidase [Legionella taurinensis]MDX1838215.1 L,D-transpeptidase [Legionella taurinensis]PUT39292.1 L,D-transpeptidase [Legionella taurinensis]PUT40638.1 L,D-transpeptidase [Legionella taurinensis]PUT44058.1 L,D-transpeptidase [Legionella taurinensis]PUT46320.1 L,D-transpeptidase [Legionella taurinensis]
MKQYIYISAARQSMACYEQDALWKTYPVSTGKNGLGEGMGSECTPRGWHRIHSRIGLDAAENSVFVGREWTGEIYDASLAARYPGRDWILTRILQLDGMEPGRNQGGDVDSLKRYIYIHGTPDSTPLGTPGSRGCIRMRNKDMIEVADWVAVGTPVFIE